MDLFGDIDDISSDSDGDNQPPIQRQPVTVSTNLNWAHCSKLRKVSEADGPDCFI